MQANFSTILLFTLIPLILSIGVTPALPFSDIVQEADALKSTGNSLTETGSDKVCGDRLCSEVNSQHKMKHSDSMMYAGSMDIHTMMERMDKVHENHQHQMTQTWNSMTPSEQSQMFHKMQGMIEKMESMDMHEHMNMMSNMDQKHGEKKCMETLCLQFILKK